MPIVQNQGVAVHYTVTGQGPALVLQHGFASDLNSWLFYGYVQAFSPWFRVISIDARGHGGSGKPHRSEDYALPLRVADVTAVLDQEGIERTHYCGFSMGGWIGFGLATHAPHRVLSLAAGGVHAEDDDGWNAFAGIDGSDPAALLAALERTVGEPFPREARARVLANDLKALAASVQERASAAELLQQATMPILLFCGERDFRLPAVRKTAQRLPSAQLAVIPGCNHVLTFTRSDRTLPVLKEFFLAQLAG